MACNTFAASPAAITTGTAVITLIQFLAATNVRVRMHEVNLAFNGTSNTAAPILCELVVQTSAGTFTNTTTLRMYDTSHGETLQTTAKDTATAEPTDGGNVKWQTFLHPQTGLAHQFKFGIELQIGGAARLGLRVTAAASVSAIVNVLAEE